MATKKKKTASTPTAAKQALLESLQALSTAALEARDKVEAGDPYKPEEWIDDVDEIMVEIEEPLLNAIGRRLDFFLPDEPDGPEEPNEPGEEEEEEGEHGDED